MPRIAYQLLAHLLRLNRALPGQKKLILNPSDQYPSSVYRSSLYSLEGSVWRPGIFPEWAHTALLYRSLLILDFFVAPAGTCLRPDPLASWTGGVFPFSRCFYSSRFRMS